MGSDCKKNERVISMKLLIATDIFPPQSGGPATYSVTLANELSKQGVEVTIVSLNPESDRSKVTCPVYAVKPRHKLLRYIQYIALLFKHSKSVDLIYAMGPVNAGLPAWLVSVFRKKKLVVKVVGDYAWEQGVQRFGVSENILDFQKKQDYSWSVRVLRFIESFVTRHAARVVTPSVFLKKIVTGWGVGEDRIKVIYNAVHFRSVTPKEKPTHEKWILSVGRLVPWKGMDTLIELLPKVKEKFPQAKLKILGDGPQMGQLNGLVEKEKLTDSVELLGNVSHDTVLSYLASADVFVLNTNYEGLSHVILEAVSSDAYALVSNVGGNPETIISGVSGELFEYNNKDQISKVIVKALERGKQKIPSGEFFDKFQLETMIRETKKLLESL